MVRLLQTQLGKLFPLDANYDLVLISCNNRKDWGGAPYNDLVNVMDWVEKHMPEVDMTRAVALGASYGGYMVNWLNGHDLGRRFKALVCHDGIFSFAGGLLATEELYFPFHVSQPLANTRYST
jgi:dienelactone hydrolase